MLTHQSSSLNARHWPHLPLRAVISTEPYGCILSATCLGQRAGTDNETLSVEQAIREQVEFLEKRQRQGAGRAKDFDLVVADVGLVLETTLESSLVLPLAIRALEILHLWVDAYGSRDISAIIVCEKERLAEIRIEFLRNGLETTGCLLPLNLTSGR